MLEDAAVWEFGSSAAIPGFRRSVMDLSCFPEDEGREEKANVEENEMLQHA